MVDVETLRNVPYFKNLATDNSALINLTQQVIEGRYEAGQIIFLEGEVCRGIIYVVKGRVRVFKAEEGGREQVLLMVGPGETFNEVPVFDGGANPASADALESSVVWLIPTQAMQKLTQTEPPVTYAVIATLAARLRHLTVLVEDLSLKQVTSRVAKILLSQTEPVSANSLASSDIGPQLTQQQMAAMAGTVRDVVGRALRTMQSAGAIELNRGQISILDRSKLERFL